MKVSDFIIEFLIQNNIDKVFSYIGKNAHLCDSIDKYENIENIFTIHEQGAGFAADGYARVTGKTAVSTVTSGPGGTNLITSIADCYFDSIPSMFIIGDLPHNECKNDRPIRQFGFQETDIVTITHSITKYATTIKSLSDLKYEFEKAYFLSQHGRKGPVLISLPENFQFITDYNPDQEKSYFESQEYLEFGSQKDQLKNLYAPISKTLELIRQAKRPLILVGGGVRLSHAQDELQTFLQKYHIPIVYSLMGKDSIDDNYLYNLGFIGNFGIRYANLTIANADLIIVLGSRLDNLQTGRRIETFGRNAKFIQVDIDANELGIRLNIDLQIEADIKDFLTELNQHSFESNIESWQSKVLEYKTTYPSTYNLDKSNRIGNQLIQKISEKLQGNEIISVDVGEHQMLVAQSFKTKKGQRILFSGAFGAMGFSLPAAIGTALATNQPSIVITGDGGFQMNIQELEVIQRRNLPIKIFIINNQSLHMVKLRQDAYLNGNSVGSKKDYSVPHFKNIGEAYGIKSYQFHYPAEDLSILDEILLNDGPAIIDIHIEAEHTTVEPRLDFNRSFEDMRPYLSSKELKMHMIIK